MSDFFIRPRAWFRNLLVSDECWLTLGGHVFNRLRIDFNFNWISLFRKNTVLYDLRGEGAPDQWETEQAQYEPKVMALNVIWGKQKMYWAKCKFSSGGGICFGPYFIRNRPYNSAEYVRLLEEEVLPEIHGVIGPGAFNAATWMQVCVDAGLCGWSLILKFQVKPRRCQGFHASKL